MADAFAPCSCAECARGKRRFPDDPPQLGIPVSIYPSREPAGPGRANRRKIT